MRFVPSKKTAIFAILGIAALLKVVSAFAPATATISAAQALGLPLGVAFDPTNLDQNTQQLYQSMQNSLNGSTFVPNDRTNYYSAVINVNGFVLNDWGGIITNVQPNANGFLVTVDVVPSLSSDTVGPNAIICDSDYSEQYQVFGDGSFQYVGFLDTQGLAGQMPRTIVGA
jgi:hypothetical protein